MYIVFVLTVSNHTKKERTLNVVRAVNLPATAASSARLSPDCLFRCDQEVGHCESLNSLPQEPVHICKLSGFFLQFHSLAHLLLLTLTFYRILSWCPLLEVNTEERKKANIMYGSWDGYGCPDGHLHFTCCWTRCSCSLNV